MISYKQATLDTKYHDDIMAHIQSDCAELRLLDHLNGFNEDYSNFYLDELDKRNDGRIINLEYFISDQLTKKYPKLNLKFSLNEFIDGNFFNQFEKFKPLELFKFRSSQNITFDNFICSFNGGPTTGRVLLVSALHKLKFFSENYCSKNFTFSDTDLKNILGNNRFQSVFFDSNIGDKIVNFQYNRFAHEANHYVLSPIITKSFLHLVSETGSVSYYPFVTEKFLYSIINQGLFLAYAQPGWHDYLENYLGFKKYDKIFDYSFDNIKNPFDRLISLLSMVSKFANLTSDDWKTLYYLEKDTILYNYNHYITGKYILALRNARQIE